MAEHQTRADHHVVGHHDHHKAIGQIHLNKVEHSLDDMPAIPKVRKRKTKSDIELRILHTVDSGKNWVSVGRCTHSPVAQVLVASDGCRPDCCFVELHLLDNRAKKVGTLT